MLESLLAGRNDFGYQLTRFTGGLDVMSEHPQTGNALRVQDILGFQFVR